MSEVRCKLMKPPNVSKAVLHRKEREKHTTTRALTVVPMSIRLATCFV